MSVRYAPGAAYALVRPGLVVLVEARVETAVVADLWAAIVAATEAGADADPGEHTGSLGLATLLEAVTAVLDPTWRTLPGFAIAILDGQAGSGVAHIALRGAFAAEVTTSTATERVSGPKVTTWLETKATDVQRVDLLAEAGEHADATLTIADGIVLGDRLRWDVRENGAVGDDARVGAGEKDSAGAEEGSAGDEHALALAGGLPLADDAVAEDLGVADDGAVPLTAEDVDVFDGAAAVTDDHELSLDHQTEADFGRTLASFPEEWADEVADDAGDGETTEDEDAAVDGDVSADAWSLTDDAGSPADAGSLLDDAGSLLDDAGSPADAGSLDEDAASLLEDDFDDSTVLVSAMIKLKKPAQVSAQQPVSAPALQHAYPGAVPPPPPPPPPSSSSSIPVGLSTQAAPPVEPFRDPAPQGTQVLARSCFFNHPNPPARMTCAQCGGGLSPNAELVDRPSLGRVDVSTGESVDLSVPVVVGRFPKAQTAGSPVAQRLVAVPSPSQDISRSHLEIRFDGWHVLAVDLDTVNGSVLLRAGQAPRRLHPLEPTLVADGDVVDLGDGITLSFHGLV